ncbi:MAG: helix-turn-helix transcriptional regulator [Alphaproteobacteria bacterium]
MQPISETPRLFVHPDGRMDRKNAAIYLGCAPKTLADWAMKGKGPSYLKLGGKIFYFTKDLEAWVSAQPRHSGTARPMTRPKAANEE